MDGSPTSNPQLSYLDMFGYTRRGSETRPSVCSSVTLPASPAPSTSNDSGVGYHNGRLHFGDRDGTHLRTSSDQQEEERVDRICRLANEVSDLRSTRHMSPLLEEGDDGSFDVSLWITIRNDRVARVEPLPPIVVEDESTDDSDEWESDVLSEEDEQDDWVRRNLEWAIQPVCLG